MKNLKLISFAFAATYSLYLFLYHSPFYPYADEWHFDKIFHFAGGYLAVVLLSVIFGANRRWLIYLMVFLLGIGWEIAGDFLLNPWLPQNIFLAASALISWGDILADLAGAFLYLSRD